MNKRAALNLLQETDCKLEVVSIKEAIRVLDDTWGNYLDSPAQKTGVRVKLIFYFHQRVGEWPGPVGEFAEAGLVVCTQLWVLDVFGAVG